LRLKDFGRLKGISEDIILKKLRSQFLPRNLQPIFFSAGIGIDVIFEGVMEIESFEKKNNKGKIKYKK
jgi:hypothetical protein